MYHYDSFSVRNSTTVSVSHLSILYGHGGKTQQVKNKTSLTEEILVSTHARTGTIRSGTYQDRHISGQTHIKTGTYQDRHMRTGTYQDRHMSKQAHMRTGTYQNRHISGQVHIRTGTHQDRYTSGQVHIRTGTCQDRHIRRGTYYGRYIRV